MAKHSRFHERESNHKDFKGSDRREANDCIVPDIHVQKRSSRVAARVKLEEKVSGEILDVFNTHFPSADGGSTVDCQKVGMAKLLRDYVRAFGDNVLLMGDFNTGVSTSGTWSEGLEVLTKKTSNPNKAYLTETFIESHDLATADGPRANWRPR